MAAVTSGDGAVPRAGAAPAPWAAGRYTSADVDEQAASLREWDQVYEQLTPGAFAGSLHEFRCAAFHVFRETTNQSVHEAGGPRRGLRAFGVPIEMGGAARFRGEPVDPATMVTIDGDDELDFTTPRGFDILGLVVDEGALETHARAVEHRAIDTALGGRSTFRPPPERQAELRRLLLSVLQTLDANPAALENPQAQRVIANSLLTAAIAAIPDDDAPAPFPVANRQHVVDAAKAYMRAHIAEPITVADLCVALGVSRRTLQYSFQDLLGINPVRYLRALRLNGVRRDLRNPAAQVRSVQDAAANWGFWHLGHFVTDYKQMFGELPSETARRSGRPGARR